MLIVLAANSGPVSFDGLLRVTGVEPRKLFKTIARLKELGFIDWCNKGYCITSEGLEILRKLCDLFIGA